MADNETETAEKKRAVSKREILAADGSTQDDWAGAAGIRYTSLAEDFPLDVMFDDLPEEIVRGLAAFGGLTLAGNVTNSVRNGERKGEGPATEREALLAWLENLRAGNWTSPRGEVEAGIGLLAESVQRMLEKSGKSVELETITEKIKGMSKEDKAKLKKDGKVKLAMLEIQTERAAKKVAAAEGGSEVASLF
jgi:hypothetical protein